MKVNAYQWIASIPTLSTEKEYWRLLSDGCSTIVARPECTVCIDDVNEIYSLKYDKSNTSIELKDVQMIIVDAFKVTIVRKGGSLNGNKKDATKI